MNSVLEYKTESSNVFILTLSGLSVLIILKIVIAPECLQNLQKVIKIYASDLSILKIVRY